MQNHLPKPREARIKHEKPYSAPARSAEPDATVSCERCDACCCRLEVFLLTDTGVPDYYVAMDQWGGMTMARLDDGWCIALDRNTMRCSIYDRRPFVCREFEMGSYECLEERASPQ